MNIEIAVLAAVVGYLLGSLSFARIVGRLFAPDKDMTRADVAIAGSTEKMRYESVGGMMVSEQMGSKFGGITALLDILKAFLPTLAFRLAFPGQPYHLVAAIAAIIGHNWPVYHRFKGGTGFSPAYGGLLAVAPVGALVTSIVGMGAGLVVFRSFGLAFLVGPWLLVPWLWFTTHSLAHVIYGLALNIVLMLGMIPGIKQALDLQRRGVSGDFSHQMSINPMGRMIVRMGKRVGLFQDVTEFRAD